MAFFFTSQAREESHKQTPSSNVDVWHLHYRPINDNTAGWFCSVCDTKQNDDLVTFRSRPENLLLCQSRGIGE